MMAGGSTGGGSRPSSTTSAAALTRTRRARQSARIETCIFEEHREVVQSQEQTPLRAAILLECFSKCFEANQRPWCGHIERDPEREPPRSVLQTQVLRQG